VREEVREGGEWLRGGWGCGTGGVTLSPLHYRIILR